MAYSYEGFDSLEEIQKHCPLGMKFTHTELTSVRRYAENKKDAAVLAAQYCSICPDNLEQPLPGYFICNGVIEHTDARVDAYIYDGYEWRPAQCEGIVYTFAPSGGSYKEDD